MNQPTAELVFINGQTQLFKNGKLILDIVDSATPEYKKLAIQETNSVLKKGEIVRYFKTESKQETPKFLRWMGDRFVRVY